MHEIKQAVNYMGPELLVRNAPPPPASVSVHFSYIRGYPGLGRWTILSHGLLAVSVYLT